MGLSTAPECIPGAAPQDKAAAFGLGKVWTQLRLCLQISVPAPGMELSAVPQVLLSLVQCHRCVVTGAVPQVNCHLFCPALPGFGLLGLGASGVLCFTCWVSGAVPFPSHPTWLSRPELNNSHELNRISGLLCSDCVLGKGPG